jgi:hypothetical protein
MMRISIWTSTLTPAIVSILLAGCETIHTPPFLKNNGLVPDHPDHQVPATSDQSSVSEDSGFNVKEIKKLAPRASVMLEKNCPKIVQPYTLADSAGSVIVHTINEWIDKGAQTFNRPPMGRGGSTQQSQSLASARLAAKQVNWLPMEVESIYGERSHHEETNLLDRESKVGRRYYPVADQMLRQVLTRIGQRHDYNFKLFIEKSSTHNALSRPGGYLYLDQGLFESPADYPKAYFAIAHEVAHILQRHETMELQSMIIDSFSIKEDLQNAIASVATNPEAVLAHIKIGKKQFIRHHIDQELQADSCATRILSRVFPDRQELSGSLNAFLKELPKPVMSAPVPATTTAVERIVTTTNDLVEQPIKVHPTSVEREQNLRAMYAEVNQASVLSKQ